MPVTLDDIVAARTRLRGAIKQTPTQRADALSAMVGAHVVLKLENLQVTGSFKARGAGNCLALMSDVDRVRGVVCASAGNHAQGVAYHAQRFGMKATIVMPVATPLIKVTRTAAYGAEVILFGDSYDDAYARASQLALASGAVYVHAYDDDAIIAGQGTVGLELLEQVPDADVVVVPIGGGGLISGIALARKSANPRLRIVGVEAVALPSMLRAMEAGTPVEVPAGRTLAEGIAVRKVGTRTLALCQQHVDEIVTVTDDEIARAILLLLEGEKTVAEGAGAAAVAALIAGRITGVAQKTVVAMVCGGNLDVTVLSRIIERGLVQSGRLTRLSLVLPDRPGALADMLGEVAAQRANVVEVHHERAFLQGSLSQVAVQLELETRGPEHARELLAGLARNGYVPPAEPTESGEVA